MLRRGRSAILMHRTRKKWGTQLPSRQEGFHAEAASAGFFKLRGIHNDGDQSFLMKDSFELRCCVRREIAAIDHDSIPHEVVRFVDIEQMNSLPGLVQGSESVGGKSSSKNQGSFVVQRTKASVEMVAIRIDEFEWHNRNSHFGHSSCKFIDPSARAAKSITGVDTRSIRLPQQISMAFEVVSGKIDVDDAVPAVAEPVGIRRHLALTRGKDHTAGDRELSVSGLLAGEDLVGGEDHILEALDCFDGLDLTTVLMQNTTKVFPLAACFYPIDWVLSRHVWVFVIDDIEIIRRTDEHGGHKKEW